MNSDVFRIFYQKDQHKDIEDESMNSDVFKIFIKRI